MFELSGTCLGFFSPKGRIPSLTYQTGIKLLTKNLFFKVVSGSHCSVVGLADL